MLGYDHHPHGALPASRGVTDAGFANGAQVESIIDRLAELVDLETTQLRRRAAVDLRDFNDRKSQGLLELTRALRQFDQRTGPGETVRSRLAGLRAKLDVNRSALKLHLDAVREVSTIVSDAIREADSDGTYTPSIRNGSRSLWSD